jgi:FlaA1/EpsC-like NDP-sugar epimerase
MKTNWRYFILAVMDILAIIVSIIGAMYLKFGWEIPSAYQENLNAIIGSFIAVRFTVFILFGTYRSLWKYASVGEALSLVYSVGMGTAILVLIDLLIDWISLPVSIYIIDMMVITGLVGSIRFFLRLRRWRVRQKNGRRTLIIGAGDAGARLLEDIQAQPSLQFNVVGFVDDNPSKLYRYIHGVCVLGNRYSIPALVEERQVQQIIIAMPSVSPDITKEIVSICKQTSADLKILPATSNILNAQVKVTDVREISIEDLLRREPVHSDLESISGYLRDKVVLVTGAGGSIGRELCRQIAHFSPKELILLGHGENSIFEIHQEMKNSFPQLKLTPIIADVRNFLKIDRIFAIHHPHVVFHAAAHKHVPLMEANVDEAVTNNVFGTRNVALASDRYNTECFVMVSTDKAVYPSSIMGATKRAAEMVVRDINNRSKTRFISVRFGNVLNSRGSVVPIFYEQIKRGGPVTVTDPEMKRFFMTIPEAVQLIIQAGALGEGGEIFVLDMGEPIKIVDLANDLIRLSGFEPGKDIKVEFTGIRPGEKLFEELHQKDEIITETQHNRILRIKGNGVDSDSIQSFLLKMEQKLDQDPQYLEGLLYQMVGTSPIFEEVQIEAATAIDYEG